MDEELISKKELLALTGISYGALYRWKRKRLIPEEWFIKKSTFTGPETFFPKEKALGRIARIMELKENLSLDDMAEAFSGAPVELKTTSGALVARGLLSRAVERLAGYEPGQTLDFYGAFYLYLCDGLLADGQVTAAETDLALSLLLSDFRRFSAPPALYICRRQGVSFCLLAEESGTVVFDDAVNTAVRLCTGEKWEQLKTSLEDEG